MNYIATYKTLDGKTYNDILCPADFPFFFKYIMKKKFDLVDIVPEEKTFGRVCWYDEDLANALENHDIQPTAENIAKLREKVDTHWFTDAMIETGWEFIYESIFNINWED